MTDLRTTRLSPVTCPYCRHKLDAATAWDDPDATPSKDDATLCIQCGGLLIFDGEPLAPRVPTEAELRDCSSYLPVHTLARAIAKLHEHEREQ